MRLCRCFHRNQSSGQRASRFRQIDPREHPTSIYQTPESCRYRRGNREPIFVMFARPGSGCLRLHCRCGRSSRYLPAISIRINQEFVRIYAYHFVYLRPWGQSYPFVGRTCWMVDIWWCRSTSRCPSFLVPYSKAQIGWMLLELRAEELFDRGKRDTVEICTAEQSAYDHKGPVR